MDICCFGRNIARVSVSDGFSVRRVWVDVLLGLYRFCGNNPKPTSGNLTACRSLWATEIMASNAVPRLIVSAKNIMSHDIPHPNGTIEASGERRKRQMTKEHIRPLPIWRGKPHPRPHSRGVREQSGQQRRLGVATARGSGSLNFFRVSPARHLVRTSESLREHARCF